MYDGPLRIPTASTAARAASTTCLGRVGGRPDMGEGDAERGRLCRQPVGDRERRGSGRRGRTRSPSPRARRRAPRRGRCRSATPRAPPRPRPRAPPASWTSASPRCPCRSGAFTTHGNGSEASCGSSARACGTPAAANASRCRLFDVASAPLRASIGCGRPIRSATRAAIPTGQSAPGETIPSTSRARASRSIPSSSSDESTARSSASGKPAAPRVAVDGDHVEVAARPRGLEQAELGGPCA